MPCSASGIAQPMRMSSRSSSLSPLTRSMAARMATAAISSGRVADNFPFGALPTAVRTADTITAEVMKSVPQYFAFFQQMLHAGECLLFAAERFECLSLKVQKILLRCRGHTCSVASTDDMRQLACDMRFVIRNMASPPHQI